MKYFNLLCIILIAIFIGHTILPSLENAYLDRLTLQGRVTQVEKEISKLQEHRIAYVTLTAYNAEVSQCDADPLINAAMKTVREGDVAVSRDLFKRGWVFGRKIYIPGIGIKVINDLMNKRYTNSIDIFMWNKDAAKKFGRINGEAYLID
jgi:3D (Asp-Asp-Asp) domain-containing protein